MDATTGILTRVAGNGFPGFNGDGGPAVSASLRSPTGVAIDSFDNLYIADFRNHRIRRVDAATGIITTVAGNGSFGFSGDGGPATDAGLNDALGVAVDSADNLYIADSLNNRVRKVDALGIITTVAGDGSSGFSGDGGPATDAGLNNPVGLAVDSADNLYIAELGEFNRIRKVDASTGIITTVAGGEGRGGDGGLATDARLNAPFGVTLDSADNLYIAEFGDIVIAHIVSGNQVRRVDAATGIITTVAGDGRSFGFGGDGGLAINASLASPFGVALDSADNLYIADMNNNRIRKVGAVFGIITTVAGNGSPDISGDGAPAIRASLADPRGVALDSADNLYIADFSSNQIRKVDAATGIITTVAGNGSSDFTGDGDLATSASLSSPTGVALDSDDNLYIADLNNQRIRRVDAASGNITTVAGDGILGFNGDGGPATSASLANPTGVALDSADNLYIADFSNSRIRKVDVATGIITTVAGNGTAGFSGDGGPATSASLANPTGVALDGSNNLYIADLNHSRIRKVDAVTGVITTVAGNGIAGFSGDGGPATSASLRSPFGVALDSADNLYIADLNSQRIRKVDAATGVITTVAGDGTFGFSGDGGPAIGASLRSATGVALDSADNLYIADSNNQRIRKIEFLAAQARNKSILETYGQIPLYFEANQGQADSQVRFLSRGRGYSLFLTPSEAVLTLEKPVEAGNEQPVTRTRLKDHESRLGIQTETVHMRLGGANLHPKITGLEESGKVNYFIGNDPKNWRTGIPTFKKVRYKDVYPGVDLIYYGNQGKLEYDFVVAPGTDPQIIRLRFEGLNSPLQVDSEGDLVLLESGGGDLRLQKPIIYQEIGGRRRQIAGGYSLQNDDSVGFELGVYDPSKTLIIDPVLEYSTRLGGRKDGSVEGIAVDDAGNAYLTGRTEFIPFTTGRSTSEASVFVAKLDSTGSELLYFTVIASSFSSNTFFGDGRVTVSQSIAVDGVGNAYVIGSTTHTFPTVNALQPAISGVRDAFVFKLDPTGSALIYSTYLGGSGSDTGKGIAVDDAGNAYLTGGTNSADFPVTANAPQPALSGGFDAFVAKLDSTGSALIYSTYLGGGGEDSAEGIAVDDAGNAYLTGGTSSTDFPITANAFQPFIQGENDAFVAKLDSTGSALIYSTYLGGSGEDSAAGIAVDDAGNAYLVGNTSSVDFPITANALQPSFAGVFSDATVTKLDPTGSALIYSTYLGGTGEDQGSGIAVDGFGRAFVTGQSSPSAFIGAAFGTFVAQLNSTGSGLVFLTSLVTGEGGGLHSLRESQPGIAVDDAGNAYVTGTTDSRDFPRVNALPPDFEDFRVERVDVFVAKIIDKRTEIGFFRNGVWSLDFNGNGQWDGCGIDQCIPFGLAGDLPVTGDWDGSGTTKIGVFRNGGWSLDFNGNGQWDGCGIDQCIPFGLAGDLPVTGDWDGSGTTKLGVVRSGGWSLDFNGNGQWDGCGIDQCIPFGLSGDLPVTGDWDGSGTTDIGVFQDGRWALDSTGSGQSDDCTTVECINFGLTGDLPVTGQWR